MRFLISVAVSFLIVFFFTHFSLAQNESPTVNEMESYFDINQQFVLTNPEQNYPEIYALMMKGDSLKARAYELEDHSQTDEYDEEELNQTISEYHIFENDYQEAVIKAQLEIIEKSDLTVDRFEQILEAIDSEEEKYTKVFYDVLVSKFQSLLINENEFIPGFNSELFKWLFVRRAELLLLQTVADQEFAELAEYSSTISYRELQERTKQIYEPSNSKVEEILSYKDIEEEDLRQLDALLENNYVLGVAIQAFMENKIKFDSNANVVIINN